MKPEHTKRSRRIGRRRDARDRLAQENERLRRENERLREQLTDQAKRIADLERKLALREQNSTTISKPPSSDGLAGHQRVRGRRVKSRRRPGGQPGHPGHTRALVPPEPWTRWWIMCRVSAVAVRAGCTNETPWVIPAPIE